MSNPKFTRQGIENLLKDYPTADVKRFSAYIMGLATEKDKSSGNPKNPWILWKTDQDIADYFIKVAAEGLVFDGDTIILISYGVSFNYQAYKNKMLLAYPESMIDVQLVYKEDTFNFEKDSGKVEYTHKIANPFSHKDADIIGAYCIVKNRRGEFLTTMSPEEIEKHRKVAKTDKFWRDWFSDMCRKTVIKKACGVHFKDTFAKIEEMDNLQNDLENPIGLELKWKQEVDEINDIEDLRTYYMDNKGRGKEFDAYVKKRKEEILALNQEQSENS